MRADGRPASTRSRKRRRRSLLAYVGDEACKETSQRVRPASQDDNGNFIATNEGGVTTDSGEADLVRRVPPTTSMNPTASTDRAPPTSTLSRPKHASQPRKTAHFRKQTLDSMRRESQRAHPALPRRPKRGTRKECPTTPGTQSQRTFRYGTPPWTRTGLPTRLHGCGCAATKSIQTDTGTGAYSYNDPSLNSTSIVLVASS